MLHWVNDYRQEVGDVWARKERGNKQGYIQSFSPLVKQFMFKRNDGMASFMRNLMDTDGRDVYEAMYVLCCIADRIKRNTSV